MVLEQGRDAVRVHLCVHTPLMLSNSIKESSSLLYEKDLIIDYGKVCVCVCLCTYLCMLEDKRRD